MRVAESRSSRVSGLLQLLHSTYLQHKHSFSGGHSHSNGEAAANSGIATLKR